MTDPWSRNRVELGNEGVISDEGVKFLTAFSGELEPEVRSSKVVTKMDSI